MIKVNSTKVSEGYANFAIVDNGDQKHRQFIAIVDIVSIVNGDPNRHCRLRLKNDKECHYVTISMATMPLFNGDTLLENAIQRFKPDGSIVAWVLEPR